MLSVTRWANTPRSIIVNLRTGDTILNTAVSTGDLSDDHVRAIRADDRFLKLIAVDYKITVPMVLQIKN